MGATSGLFRIMRGKAAASIGVAVLACALPVPARALMIIPSFDASFSAPANAAFAPSFEAAVANAIQVFESTFSDPIYVPITFSLTNAGGAYLGQSGNFTRSIPYIAYETALFNDADKGPNDKAAILSLLPNPFVPNNAVNNQPDISVRAANFNALGLTVPGGDPASYANISINVDLPFQYPRGVNGAISSGVFDLTRTIEHEIDEVLGLGSTLDTGNLSNPILPEDLFRYSAPGVRSYTTDETAIPYLSIDEGAHKIVGLNQALKQDHGDWANPTCPANPPHVQDTPACPGQIANLGAPEITALDVIGYDPKPPCDFECFNAFTTITTSPASSFTVVLQGNLSNEIYAAATGNDPLVNPFAYVIQNFFAGNGTASATVNFNGVNTEITYTGSHPILPSYSFDYGGGLGDPHFGFQGVAGALPLHLAGQFWTTTGTAPPPPVPILDITCLSAAQPSTEFDVFFAKVTVNGQTTGEWNECPGGSQQAFLLTNPTGSRELLSDVGYLVSDTPIPLDMLNVGWLTPPGELGSRFNALPDLDARPLAPGESIQIDVAEPSTLLLFGTGLAGFVASLSPVNRSRRRHLNPGASSK